MDFDNNVQKQIYDFYNNGAEIGRLERGIGKIEFERTKDIISRYISPSTQVIYDIGGGIGVYSNWLATLGHEVHLFDLAPQAIEYAKAHQEKLPMNKIQSMEVSDARTINRPCESADVVLLMGPLYHLTEKSERMEALKEASRVLRKNGILIVSAISRYSSTLWGLSVYGQKNNFIDEPEFTEMIYQELSDGQHIRPDKYPYFIARSYFHTPQELAEEIEKCGFCNAKTLSVEGPVWIVPSFEEKWSDHEDRSKLLEICQRVEDHESLMGISPHILSIARKVD